MATRFPKRERKLPAKLRDPNLEIDMLPSLQLQTNPDGVANSPTSTSASATFAPIKNRRKNSRALSASTTVADNDSIAVSPLATANISHSGRDLPASLPTAADIQPAVSPASCALSTPQLDGITSHRATPQTHFSASAATAGCCDIPEPPVPISGQDSGRFAVTVPGGPATPLTPVVSPMLPPPPSRTDVGTPRDPSKVLEKGDDTTLQPAISPAEERAPLRRVAAKASKEEEVRGAVQNPNAPETVQETETVGAMDSEADADFEPQPHNRRGRPRKKHAIFAEDAGDRPHCKNMGKTRKASASAHAQRPWPCFPKPAAFPSLAVDELPAPASKDVAQVLDPYDDDDRQDEPEDFPVGVKEDMARMYWAVIDYWVKDEIPDIATIRNDDGTTKELTPFIDWDVEDLVWIRHMDECRGTTAGEDSLGPHRHKITLAPHPSTNAVAHNAQVYDGAYQILPPLIPKFYDLDVAIQIEILRSMSCYGNWDTSEAIYYFGMTQPMIDDLNMHIQACKAQDFGDCESPNMGDRFIANYHTVEPEWRQEGLDFLKEWRLSRRYLGDFEAFVEDLSSVPRANMHASQARMEKEKEDENEVVPVDVEPAEGPMPSSSNARVAQSAKKPRGRPRKYPVDDTAVSHPLATNDEVIEQSVYGPQTAIMIGPNDHRLGSSRKNDGKPLPSRLRQSLSTLNTRTTAEIQRDLVNSLPTPVSASKVDQEIKEKNDQFAARMRAVDPSWGKPMAQRQISSSKQPISLMQDNVLRPLSQLSPTCLTQPKVRQNCESKCAPTYQEQHHSLDSAKQQSLNMHQAYPEGGAASVLTTLYSDLPTEQSLESTISPQQLHGDGGETQPSRTCSTPVTPKRRRETPSPDKHFRYLVAKSSSPSCRPGPKKQRSNIKFVKKREPLANSKRTQSCKTLANGVQSMCSSHALQGSSQMPLQQSIEGSLSSDTGPSGALSPYKNSIDRIALGEEISVKSPQMIPNIEAGPEVVEHKNALVVEQEEGEATEEVAKTWKKKSSKKNSRPGGQAWRKGMKGALLKGSTVDDL